MIYSQSNEPKSSDVPRLNPAEYRLWRLQFLACLGAKKCRHVVEDQIESPQPDGDKVVRLRRENRLEDLAKYLKHIEKLQKTHQDDNAMAYFNLVLACAGDYDAMTLVIMNEQDKGAYSLLKKLDARFDDYGQIGPLQAKIASFNAMAIDPKELATHFIGRVTRAQVAIMNSGSGQDYSLDIHGVGRLKEGLLHDPRYKHICHVIRGQSNITWQEAVDQITAYEQSEALTIANASSKTSDAAATATLGPSQLRRTVLIPLLFLLVHL